MANKISKFFAYCLTFTGLLSVCGLSVAQPITLEKDIPMELIPEDLNTVEFCLFDAEIGGQQVACQSFGANDWTADYHITAWDSNSLTEKPIARIKVDNFTNNAITPDHRVLWIEVALNGIVADVTREHIEIPLSATSIQSTR